MIHGNLEGIKDSILNEIEQIYDFEIDKNFLVSKDLVIKLCEYTELLNREVSVYINRKGKVLDISIGTHTSVSLQQIDVRRAENRLSGIRCIHTHPAGDGRLSDVDINSMLKLKLDCIASIGVMSGQMTEMYCAVHDTEGGQLKNAYTIFGPIRFENVDGQNIMAHIIEVDIRLDTLGISDNTETQERAILVGVQKSDNPNDINRTCEKSIDELELLTETAGAVTVEKILQNKRTLDSGFYIGRGKAEEISLLRQSLNANLIIFDDELSGAQIRNLEEVIGAKVLDRTALILDIFAKHAKSKEGKIQVELAQLRYRLPRLIGMGSELSRLGGGIGSRGPGEKKLEIDRRHIYRRISYLEEELEEIKKQRELQRSQRSKNKIPVVALVGYTNAGKSTLMNALSDAGVLAENKLFATLDPTVRKFVLNNGQDILLIDTVGFIRKLPHHLVEAFKSTLEETLYADVLIHVIDSTSSEYETQRKVVLNILESLGASDKPIIAAYNKIDLVEEESIISYPDETAVKISAKGKINLEQLLEHVKAVLPESFVEFYCLIPYSEGHIVSALHLSGKVVSEEYTNEGTKVKAIVSKEVSQRYKQYSIENQK